MDASGWLIATAIVAGINPLRIATALPRGHRPAGERAIVAVTGASTAAAVLVVLALAGSTVAGWLSVSEPTLRVAAGVVLAVGGLIALVTAAPASEPALRGRGAALVPVAIPLVLRPDIGLVALDGGTGDRVGAVVAGCVVASLAVALVAVVDVTGADAGLVVEEGAVPRAGSAEEGSVATRVVRWGGRWTAAVAVLAGLGLLVGGVLDV